MPKKLIAVAFVMACFGASCWIPSRTRTILPPTNENTVCQSDNRHFSSPDFNFCFPYPKDWLNPFVLTKIGNDTLGGYEIYLPNGQQRVLMFTLTIFQPGSTLPTGETVLTKPGQPYVITVKKNDTIPASFQPQAKEIDAMLKQLIFVKP